MSKAVISGWILELLGTALWIFGYFTPGHSPLMDLHATPWWIADYLENLESQVGMVLVFAGMVPLYWPTSQTESAGAESSDSRLGGGRSSGN